MSNKRKLYCECQALPSRHQRRSLRRRKVCEVVETASASSGSTEMGTPLSFTKVLTSEYQIHTSIHQCALILPRRFCDEHNVPNHVTMADSTGHKLWHMRCNDSRVEEGMMYKISNGWREFAYDHSLKLRDELVFTFVPPSHFVVEFATGVMRPTRDGKKYPWKKPRGRPWLNYSENVQRVAKAKSVESNSNGVSGLVKSSASTSRGSTNTTSPPSFTKILTSKCQIHTSVRSCCLSLPRLFCDEHKVPNNVTMTDSSGHTLWRMRCNDRVSTKGGYRISKGWREFAHDHSLKLYNKLVFTLVSPSHFVVNFATSRRLMRSTQERKNSPQTLIRSSKVSGLHVPRNIHGVDTATTFKLPLPRQQSDPESNTVKIKSQKRKETSRRHHHMRVVSRRVSNLAPEATSASGGSIDKGAPSSFTKVLTSKFHIHTSAHRCVMVIPRPFCDEHNVPNHVTMTDSIGHKLWHMRCQNRVAIRGVYKICNGWREFAYDHSLKLNDTLVFTFVPPSHFVVEFATGVMRPTRDGKEYPWIRRRNSYSINIEAQARATTTLPNSSKQSAEGDILYKSSRVKVENQNGSLKDSTSKLPGFPELTHLECKNPDGTPYLQLLDSDGDVTDDDEEVAHGSVSG